MQRPPYTGIRRKLVLAFDIGTTYSGISYSILDPGVPPTIQGVNQFSGQEKVGGDTKVPTVVYYDTGGNIKAIGSDCTDDDWALDQSEMWFKAEWFKLHMRPRTLHSQVVNEAIPPLPPNKTVTDVVADFMRYLFEQAKKYIIDHNPNGENFWTSLERHIEFVITHPNGWEGPQQAMLRQALVKASLILDTDDGHNQVQFLTEGEASLNFCILNGLSADIKNTGVIVLDLGGGTVDLSCYTSVAPGSFEEIARPLCLFNGSIFVTREARRFLEDDLRGSKFKDDVNTMVKIFDQKTKLACHNDSDPLNIQFGSLRDKDPAHNIKSGRKILPGPVVAGFFEPSIQAIVSAIKHQMALATVPVSSVYVVGGFGASQYVFNRLRSLLAPLGLKLSRPDSFLNKAVAEGAVSFYLDHFVNVRISKMIYGIECTAPYNASDSEHRLRHHTVKIDAAGDEVLPDAFSVILNKDVRVAETKEFRTQYYRATSQILSNLSETILCYRGEAVDPRWMDLNKDEYTKLCTIEADISSLSHLLEKRPSKSGKPPHFRVEFSIILLFGLTELKAQIAWTENGVEKRSPARIVYDQHLLKAL